MASPPDIQERQEFRRGIEQALREDDDPLSAYDHFVKWISQRHNVQDADSGLTELLEEVTRKFKDDPRYKSDIRYLRLWCAYAKQTEKPSTVFAFVYASEIGAAYAMLYEEYANALEREGRFSEADKIYCNGISRSARPIERLKTRYREFQSRPSSSKPLASTVFQPSGSAELDTLRRNPFKNYHISASQSTASQKSDVKGISTSPNSKQNRYAPMLAPAIPGRRPEKLRFNLSLLFTEEGVEYSAAEVRARSLGLFGKKWGPPPPSELRESASSTMKQVNFNDDNAKSTRTIGRQKGMMGAAPEPTVTINTKEALADVFSMYNSPDKTTKRQVPGSKHAPVKKIEPVTPMIRQSPPGIIEESANVKTPAFKPFMDEPSNRKENITPAPKFKPFVDESPKQMFITPDVGRQALAAKEPAAVPRTITDENVLRTVNGLGIKTSLKGFQKTENNKGNGINVFSPVFTPVSQKEPLVRSHVDGQVVDAKVEVTEDIKEGKSPSGSATLIGSKNQFKVFSRPPSEAGKGHERILRPPFASRMVPFKPSRSVDDVPRETIAPSPTFKDDIHEELNLPQQEDNSEDYEDEEDYDGGHFEQVESATPSSSEDQGDSQSEQNQDEDGDFESYSIPLGGRFGRVDVMTPITERTFEYTSSTRGLPTPRESDAVEVAERLAAELREDEENDFVDWHEGESQPSFAFHAKFNPDRGESPTHFGLSTLEQKTEALSLSDTLTSFVSSFKPPNPCNPFDPIIASSLVSVAPADKGLHDLRDREAHMLDELQNFARRTGRRGSGSSSKGMQEAAEGHSLTLDGKKFSVLGKLGEGGFGAVFAARDLSLKQVVDDDFDEDEDDDNDNDLSMVALKVVRPRNLWEFHALRRIHRTLPEDICRSIIGPRALYAYQDESFLVLDLCSQGTLLDIVNRAVSAGVAQQGACLDELLVFFFAIELLRFVEAMHKANFIHGDLKIDNCLLRLEDLPGGPSSLSSIYQPSGEGGWKFKGIKVIDFGRTIDTGMFPPGQQYIADWPAEATDCFEIRENRPWTYQTDYFGLAAIIYCMLYGKYIDASSITSVSSASPGSNPRYKIATPFKRYWQNNIWTALFDILLNPCLVQPEGKLPLCDELAEIRGEMEKWLQSNCNRSTNTLKGLLKKIELSLFTR